MVSALSASDYDDQWGRLQDFIQFNPGARHRRRLIAAAVKQLPEPRTVLDAGCGLGFTVRDLSRQIPANRITGLDFSTTAVDWARLRFPESNWVAADLTASSIASEVGRHDLVLCTEVIEHIEGPQRVLATLVDLVEPGGHLILTTQAGKVHGTERAVGHLRHFTRRELSETLTELGTTVVRSVAWGWPGMMVLKYLANVDSEVTMAKLGSGSYGLVAKTLNHLAYGLSRVGSLHSSALGPQLLLVVNKPSAPSA